MSTFADVVASLKNRAASQITQLPVYWDRDARPVLPNVPSPFVFARIELDLARFVAFGGGLGKNLQRTDGELQCYVFVPRDWGLEQEAALGEHVCAAFRSFVNEHVRCYAVVPQPAVPGSALQPDGIDSEVENYSCIVAAVPFTFDQIG